jgi:hypothetical protein
VGDPVDSLENAFGGVAYDGTYLYVGDQSLTDPGIVVIDPSDNSKVSGPHDMGMPPSSLAILRAE